MADGSNIDYTTWDWLPEAAEEMQAYISRLLAESGIRAHDVSARAKSIASFRRKQELKGYENPLTQITDIVAIRIITYSTIDRDRAADLVRERFVIPDGEDRNPGEDRGRPDSRRGYDCRHLVVTGEKPPADSGWVVAGGKLQKYFAECGGLEIQIRTVAGHAWAEFEHARRYKGAQYAAISAQDQSVIDGLFGAAADARSALDSIFKAIDGFLASPSAATNRAATLEESDDRAVNTEGPALEIDSLTRLLADRYPEDGAGSEKGVEFALDLARACGLTTIGAAETALDTVDHEQVVRLMDTSVPVTRVRRFDDDLLARFEEEYISRTGAVGAVANRRQQLEWRFDRLRGKTRYKTYTFEGEDAPDDLTSRPFTASLAVRELARAVAHRAGVDVVLVPDAISRLDDLKVGSRAVEVSLADGTSIWVATNIGRGYAEEIMQTILRQAPGLDVRVRREGFPVAGFDTDPS